MAQDYTSAIRTVNALTYFVHNSPMIGVKNGASQNLQFSDPLRSRTRLLCSPNHHPENAPLCLEFDRSHHQNKRTQDLTVTKWGRSKSPSSLLLHLITPNQPLTPLESAHANQNHSVLPTQQQVETYEHSGKNARKGKNRPAKAAKTTRKGEKWVLELEFF